MTLRCWMHWFWITTLLVLLESSRWTSALPQHSQEYGSGSTEINSMFDSRLEAEPLNPKPASSRRSKALYFEKTAQTTAPLARTTPVAPSKGPDVSEVDRGAPLKDADKKQGPKNTSEVAITQNVSNHQNVSVEVVEEDNAPMKISLLLNETQILPVTVKVVNDSVSTSTEGRSVTNRTNATVSKSLVVEDSDSESSESDSEGGASSRRAVLTQRPLSLAAGGTEVRGGRGARVSLAAAGGARALDAGAVAGLAFAALALVALAGAVGFVLYRRRYLNKPQTLNDKCSNPDSSGYIDDSTIRENSEEMYSLDNDSFLNSLEAMTIQNYWTDSVKHTKL